MENLKQGQSIMDFAIQHTGSAEGLFAVLKLNGLKALDFTNQDLAIPVSIRPKIVSHFAQNRIIPSSYKKSVVGSFSISFSNAFNI